MANFTLDQIQTFLAVVDQGSFSAAARKSGHAQPAVTYAIRKLESALAVQLFDTSDYRPVLTDAGRLLLPHARRLVEDAGVLSLHSSGIAAGFEQELAIVIDPTCPMERFTECIVQFRRLHPSVQLRFHSDVLDGVTRQLLEGNCTIGLVSAYGDMPPALERRLLSDAHVGLVMVTAPHHPLAQQAQPIPDQALRDAVQIALMERSGTLGLRDYAVLANQVWRMGDVTTMLAMLRAGLGFGLMPDHLVKDDIQAGRLVSLRPRSWESGPIPLPVYVAWKVGPLGPAARWIVDFLSQDGQ